MLTSRQLEILQHSLGVDQYGQGKMYRNHFCAGGEDEQICLQLVEMGFMHVWHPNESPLPYCNCAVTDAGKRAMIEASPKPPKLTPSQRRYRAFMDSGAGDCGYTFGEWLKRGAERYAG